MQTVQLQSRLLASAGYNQETQSLHVWFKNRKHVIHAGVAEHVFRNLIEAESPGFYYTYYISDKEPPKKGIYGPVRM
jgi:hypothetical protein